jgi:hypothetical protein
MLPAVKLRSFKAGSTLEQVPKPCMRFSARPTSFLSEGDRGGSNPRRRQYPLRLASVFATRYIHPYYVALTKLSRLSP